MVSVSSLWADEGVYYPLEVESYTPAHRFQGGKGDPGFLTKLKIASQLVERSVATGVPFRAWSRIPPTARRRVSRGP